MSSIFFHLFFYWGGRGVASFGSAHQQKSPGVLLTNNSLRVPVALSGDLFESQKSWSCMVGWAKWSGSQKKAHHHFGFNSALLHLCPTTKQWWTWTCRILTLTPFHVVIIFYSLIFKLLCMEQPLLWTGFRENRLILQEQFTVGSIKFYLLFS